MIFQHIYLCYLIFLVQKSYRDCLKSSVENNCYKIIKYIFIVMLLSNLIPNFSNYAIISNFLHCLYQNHSRALIFPISFELHYLLFRRIIILFIHIISHFNPTEEFFSSQLEILNVSTKNQKAIEVSFNNRVIQPLRFLFNLVVRNGERLQTRAEFL